MEAPGGDPEDRLLLGDEGDDELCEPELDEGLPGELEELELEELELDVEGGCGMVGLLALGQPLSIRAAQLTAVAMLEARKIRLS